MEDHLGLIAPLNFIVAVHVFIILLDTGMKVSVVPYSIAKDPSAVGSAFAESGVDPLFCAPSVFRLFRKIPTLKKFLVGSEPANGIWSDDPEVQVINGYNRIGSHVYQIRTTLYSFLTVAIYSTPSGTAIPGSDMLISCSAPISSRPMAKWQSAIPTS
ncbi:MAG: hypothetical protein IKH57_14285, partial [Clostridia bacterium]|nr:hypothetical protein [Clostridia bacterium]